VPAVFAVLTVIAASRQWRTDLVETRRWLRGFIVVAGVGYTLALVVARVLVHGRFSSLGATIDEFFLLVIVAVIAARLLRVGGFEGLVPEPDPPPTPAPEPLRDRETAAPPAEPDLAEERLIDALRRAMQVERAYRTEDLTVAVLAARLAVPEYRLRRVINQRLGFRNFNVYVNSFRLEEAREALADAGKRDLPILTIALDAGFQSIGPFNRAFKLATGLTPGEFRREKLADS
jgi:AraC-like DNA-binding protein